MRILALVLICALSISFVRPLSGQETLIVNLADLTPGRTTTRTVEPGTYRVRVISLLPDRSRYSYDVSVQRVFRPLGPIAIDTVRTLRERLLDRQAQEPAECVALSTAAANLLAATDEAQVPGLRSALLRALQAGQNCSQTVQDAARGVEGLTSQTTEESFELRRQDDLVVTVVRTTIGGSESRSWTMVFSTGPGGQWRPTYGLAFVSSGGELYHTVASTTAGQFTIQKQEDRRDWDYVPNVMYAYFPNRSQALSISPTLGLGYHRDKAAVLGGVLFSYRENIGLSLGGAYLAQPQLLGTYTAGSVVQQNLTERQLHEDQYQLTWYVAATIRSLTAPFQTAQQSPNTTTP